MGDDVTFVGCTFEENSASDKGGALYSEWSSDATLSGCTFNNNSAGKGGAIYSSSEGRVTIGSCSFTGSESDPSLDSIAGDRWQTVGPAPAPSTGACCHQGGCIVATEADCLAAGGTYMGDDTDCDTAGCPEPCPPDITGDYVVDVLDLLEVLSAWGPCL